MAADGVTDTSIGKLWDMREGYVVVLSVTDAVRRSRHKKSTEHSLKLHSTHMNIFRQNTNCTCYSHPHCINALVMTPCPCHLLPEKTILLSLVFLRV